MVRDDTRGLTDPVDASDTPLVEGRVYNFYYATSQTSGASLDEAEFAKATVVQWGAGR